MTRPREIRFCHQFWGFVLRFLVWLLLRVEVSGLNNVPPQGAGIVYYNHIHWLDPPLICSKLPRYSIPLAKVEASRWAVVGLLLRWYGAVFITRGEVDRSALQMIWQVLRDGDVAVISPEGTRSADGRLQQAKEGLAFIGREVPEAWWIPCAVTGTPRFAFSLRKLLERPCITITFGRPLRVLWPEANSALGQPGRTSRAALREITDEAMVQLAALLPPEMRGDYAGGDPDARKWLEYLEPGVSSCAE